MPNGFHGPDKEWQRMEAPLVALDPILSSFADRYGLAKSANYHSWPERSLTWGQEITRTIQIYLKDEEELNFDLWLCAWQDRGKKRFWRREFLFKDQTPDQFAPELEAHLEEGLRRVNQWTEKDLEFATDVSPLPGSDTS